MNNLAKLSFNEEEAFILKIACLEYITNHGIDARSVK